MNKRSKSEHYFQLLHQNQRLLGKIQQSKPLLSTIYDKIKKKEEYLFQTILEDRKKIKEVRTIANDYQRLYEDSVDIMQRRDDIGKYGEFPGNYLGMKQYQRQKYNNKSKSVYEQYKQRINRGMDNLQQEKNPQLKALKKQNDELKNQMLFDIDRLRVVREKSQKRLKKAQSTKVMQKQPRIEIEAEQKKRIVEKQREKLARIQ